MTSVVSRLVTTIFVLNPVLSMYGTGVGTVTLFDAFLFIPILMMVFEKGATVRLRLRRSRALAFYIVTVSMLSLLNMLHVADNAVLDVALRTMRYLFYLVYLYLFGKTYFEYELAKRLFRYLAIFATVFLFYQYFALFVLGYYPRGYVDFLPLTRPGLRTHFVAAVAEQWFRPRSIFGEPSQYGIVAGTYLVWSLVTEKRISVDKLLIGAGLVISASGTAYLVLMVAWASWMIVVAERHDRVGFSRLWSFRLGLAVIFCISVWALLSVLASDSYSEFIYRGLRRVKAFSLLPSALFTFPLVNVLFGFGMTTSIFETWPSSIVRVIYYFGYLGLIAYVSLLIVLWRQARYEWQKFMVLLLAVFSVGNEVGVSSPLLFSLYPLIVYDGVHVPAYQRVRSSKELPA